MSNLISSYSIDLCYERKSGIKREREGGTQTRVARSKKVKKAKFGHKQLQKGQIMKNEKRPNKGQISIKNLLK